MTDLIFQLREVIFSKVTKDASVLLLGNIVSSGMAVFFTVLAARVLGPEQWGIVAAVGSLITILVAFGDLGMSAALFRFVSKKWSEGERRVVQKTINLVWSLRLLSILFFSIVLLLASGKLAYLLLNSGNPLLIVFTVLGFAGSLLVDFQIATSEARQEWRYAALFISLTNVLRVLLIILTNASSLTAVLFIFAGSPVVAFLISFIFKRASFGFMSGWQDTMRELIPFSGLMGVNRVISSVNSRIDVLLLIQISGAYEAGIYGAANRLAIGVPIVLGSFATVLAPRFASFTARRDQSDFFRRSVGLSGLITLGLVVGIFVAPYVVSLFGPDYVRSEIILQLLFLAFVPQALSVPAVNFVIYGLKKPHIITALSFIELPIIILTNIILIPKIGVFAPVIALGIANLLTMTTSFCVSWWSLWRKA